MEKEKFISKFNIKDYNNQLEKILSKKTFDGDTKNLLLSMLYKIENSYKDYNTVNRDIKSKKEILEEILEIISKNCETIEIVKEKKSISIKKDKKIITYQNINKILYEIYQLKDNNFYIMEKYEFIKQPLENILNQGYSIAGSEIIRDFDGWSWNIIINEIENIKANFLYQTLKILVGKKFLEEWQSNTSKDYILELIESLENRYGVELAEQIFKLISQIAIINDIENNKSKREILINIGENLQREFDIVNNKEKYILELTKHKKKIIQEIKRIDKIINDDKLLKIEFIKENELLDMENRIFSLSDFEDNLISKRENLIIDLDKCSKNMEPIYFLKMKQELELKLNIIKELNLKDTNTDIYIIKVKEFIELINRAIKIQINKEQDKEKILNFIYLLRYYGLIYVDNKKRVKDIKSLNEIQKMAITKACKNKIITIFSKDIKENYEIVKNIFQTDIIELEKIFFKFTVKDNRYILKIYDEDNLYSEIELGILQDLNVKLNKKVKVIIA